MPRAGGVYTLPAGNPVVTLTVISSGWANSTMSDIAIALTGSLPVDGSAPMTGVLRLADGAVGTPGLAFATEPSSGLYRIGAGSYGFSVLSNLALSVNSNRGWTIPVPAGGNTLTLTQLAGNLGLLVNTAAGTATEAIAVISPNGTQSGIGLAQTGVVTWLVTNPGGSSDLRLNDGTADRLIVRAGSGVTIPVPSSGTNLTLTGTAASAQNLLACTNTTGSFLLDILANGNVEMGTVGNTQFSFYQNNSTLVQLTTAGTVNIPNGSGSLSPVYAGVPQNSQSASYTLVLADANKHLRATGSTAAQAFTIPANASVAFPIGTVVTFCNRSTVSWQINITTDTLIWAATSGVGARALASGGMATAIKTDSQVWMISGSQLT